MSDFNQMMEDLMFFYNKNVADPLGAPYIIPDRMKREMHPITKYETLDRGVNPNFPGTEDTNAFDNDPLKRDQWEPVPHQYSPDNHINTKKRT